MKKRFLLLLSLALVACGKGDDTKTVGPPPTLVTTYTVKAAPFEETEETSGTLEALVDPKISAEVPGKVTRILVTPGTRVKAGQALVLIDPVDATLQHRADQAEVHRLEALTRQQEKLAERQQQLMSQGFISKNAGEDVKAQRDAVTAQLAGARARLESSARSVNKTTISAPADGVIDTVIASVGEYVRVGDPVLTLIANGKLRAHLPFPEAVAGRIKAGDTVRMTSPQLPAGEMLEAKISQVTPGISANARAVDAVVEIDNKNGLRGGGSLDATVVVAVKPDALTVPEQGVVLRPAGQVVYVIAGGKARQQRVTTGAKHGGMIEVVSGLKGGETVALDGAGFLTDGAAVAIKAESSPSSKKP
ncbi:MAG: efflux RND transporter periplasmic adaptor subunit [Proteobacteria bacterium]|nr:efflux RND transporter periplasmic adaptor subunit [Pseudomonadota bacterium]HQR04874.1 efflux RND transporter periplasmic adaptor subunit [Rhodocyclaceae bacterium]